jgi:hypothetical protein
MFMSRLNALWQITMLAGCATAIDSLRDPRLNGEIGQNTLTSSFRLESLVPHLQSLSPENSILPRPRAVAVASPDVEFCSPNTSGRGTLEAFIQASFQRKHGAAVRSFMPVLIGLRDRRGVVIGAAGYRPAAREALYLEQYLGEPVETSVARRVRAPVARAQIAEIGNFACRDCATAMTMVSVLAEFLLDQRHRWTVFTATRTVRDIMQHLGIGLSELGRAAQSRVVASSDEWGSYYSTDPRVMLGYVPSWRGGRDITWSI